MSSDTIDDTSAPLIEHLAELRTRLIRSVLAFTIAMLASFAFAEPMLNFLVEPIAEIMRQRGQNPQLIFTAPQEKFFVLFQISMLAGLAFSFPVIAFQLWRFVAPGLYKNEQGAFLPFMIASPVLFVMGASFAHFIVTPLAMNFFIGFADIIPNVTKLLSGGEVADIADSEVKTIFLGSVKESLAITLKFIFAFGLCFQLPVLLTLMGMAGLVSAAGLRNVRKYAIVGILVLAALVTPPDVVTQIILFSVVYALYEVSILLVVMVEKKRNDRLKAEGIYFEDDEDEDKHPDEA
jgi:sec-independent protein translocase protein TatC